MPFIVWIRFYVGAGYGVLIYARNIYFIWTHKQSSDAEDAGHDWPRRKAQLMSLPQSNRFARS